MATISVHGVEIDPATVTRVRRGNRLEPGLATFTGLSFLAYLLVKAASGAVAVDMGLVAQVAAAAAMLGIGGGLMKRGRYFYVTLDTATGTRRIGGLTKTQQSEIADAVEAAISPAPPAS